VIFFQEENGVLLDKLFFFVSQIEINLIRVPYLAIGAFKICLFPMQLKSKKKSI